MDDDLKTEDFQRCTETSSFGIFPRGAPAFPGIHGRAFLGVRKDDETLTSFHLAPPGGFYVFFVSFFAFWGPARVGALCVSCGRAGKRQLPQERRAEPRTVQSPRSWARASESDAAPAEFSPGKASRFAVAPQPCAAGCESSRSDR